MPKVTLLSKNAFCAQSHFLRPGASRTIQKPCARATFSPGVAEVHFFMIWITFRADRDFLAQKRPRSPASALDILARAVRIPGVRPQPRQPRAADGTVYSNEILGHRLGAFGRSARRLNSVTGTWAKMSGLAGSAWGHTDTLLAQKRIGVPPDPAKSDIFANSQ